MLFKKAMHFNVKAIVHLYCGTKCVDNAISCLADFPNLQKSDSIWCFIKIPRNMEMDIDMEKNEKQLRQLIYLFS